MGAPLFKLWLHGLAALKEQHPLDDVEFLFIGTGNKSLPCLQELANSLGLEDIVREIPERLSYLQVQQILRASAGALVIGSVEPHYSASKIFQCLITAPRLFGFFHPESEGKRILKSASAEAYFIPYNPEIPENELINNIRHTLEAFIQPDAAWEPSLDALEVHSAAHAAKKLLDAASKLST